MSSKNKKLDAYLAEIFNKFIALKDQDLKKSQEVFKSVFEQVKQKMEEQCNYFSKYATQVLYAGSVYDGIKVSKMDEFDMNIVIRLPINYDDGEDGIIIENDQPGFVRMKIGRPFDNLDKQKEWETCHKVTREWRDDNKYFLQNKFRQWLHSIIQKALNTMNNKVTVNGVNYTLSYKSSGPAYTLNIKNTDESFSIDVDLVPVIRFMLPRWPKGYRNINNEKAKEWFVVPKPNKAIQDSSLQNRCWRLSFQEQERKIMKNLKQLKITIRLVKKLRDSLGLKCIASYYIKTLFLWKIQKINDEKYWESNVGAIFKDMVQEFYNAVEEKRIPYFWHKENNLIAGIKATVLKVYADKLKDVLNNINANNVEKVSYCLLTTEEMNTFMNSKFYNMKSISVDRSLYNDISISIDSSESNDSLLSQSSRESLDKTRTRDEEMKGIIKDLTNKISVLTQRVNALQERVENLERKEGKGDLQNICDCD